MKTKVKLTVLATLLTVCLLYVWTGLYGQNPASDTTDHIIIRYIPSYGIAADEVFIHFGNDKIERINLKKIGYKSGISNYVVDLLNKYNSEGYALISTNVFSYTVASSETTEINCYLKRQK